MLLRVSHKKYHSMFLQDQYFKRHACNHARPLHPTILITSQLSHTISYIIQIYIHNHCHSVQHQLDFHLCQHCSQEEEDNIQEMAHLAAMPSDVHG